MHKIGCFLISLWDITLTLTRPLHFMSKIGVNLGLAVGIALWFSHVNNLWKLLLNLAICTRLDLAMMPRGEALLFDLRQSTTINN